MWFEVFEEDIGGDFEQDVGDEEDDKGCVELVVFKFKFYREIEDVCVGDVDLVWWLINKVCMIKWLKIVIY